MQCPCTDPASRYFGINLNMIKEGRNISKKFTIIRKED